ncbi:hypothetical protein [Curtobacterium luteum]|uniref:Uncharacterized protein n=1 Tax=Curtobacterium luteum TaxID=33881 RepID=A0A175S1T3_9MICO|nr:hypothetical protein [Curtobacterium luteum]KTR11745.1 hypothetical protein NS184_00785 [Curtobacterium luteum]
MPQLKKKRAAKDLGASALAVATIASGLSFGATTAHAVQVGEAETSGIFAKMFWNSDPTSANGRWNAVVNDGTLNGTPGGLNYIQRFPEGRRAAEAAALEMSVPTRTSWTQVQLKGTNYCLEARGVGHSNGYYFDTFGFFDCDPLTDAQRFRLDEADRIVVQSTRQWIMRTTNDNGDAVFLRGNDDEPNMEFEGPWAGRFLSASALFADDVAQRATVSGTGKPGASIAVKNGSTVVASTTTDTNGDYSVQVAAPNRGGVVDLTVEQTVDGSVEGAVDVALDYGNAVEITGPEDQSEIPGANTAITGTGEPGSMVQVFDNDGRNPITSTTVRGDGTWAGAANLSADEHTLEAKQLSKGANTTTSTVTVNPSDGSVPAPTAEVRFGAAVTDRATVTGEAQAGATVTIRDEDGDVVGTPQVVDGRYSQVVNSPGAGVHSFFVTQQVDSTVSEPVEATGDFGAAVAVTALPAQSTPGDVTVAGTGENGRTVTVRAGSQTRTATVANGRWSVELELAPSNTAVQVSVSQTAQGNTVTTGTTSTTPNGAITARPVEIVEPSSHEYTPMAETVLSGTATPYATVKIETIRGTQIREVKADKNGNWSFRRAYGPSNVYTFIATQTRFDGTTSRSAEFIMSPVGAFRALAVTSHTDGGTYTRGENTFRGTATPDAMVRITNQWGRQVASAQANVNGAWSATGNLGPTADYTLTFTQTAPNGQQDSVQLALSPELAAYEDAALTSPTNNSTYRPGAVTFTGTGSEGTEIVAKNQWGTMIGAATVGANGQWAFERNLGPTADYQITFTAKRGTDGNTFSVNVNSPEAAPLVITSPNAGDTYTPLEQVTFTGTASPFAEIDVKTKRGTQIATATANDKGEWSFRRAFGPTSVYELVFTQTDVYGDTQPGAEFDYAPNPTK